MEDILNNLEFIIIYIDDILVCSTNLKQNAKHLQFFYDKVYKHSLALSKAKMEIGHTK